VIPPPVFLMRIAKKAYLPEEEAGIMTVVVRRTYASLEKKLRSAFKEQEDIRVILDRRHGERRKRQQPVAIDRRKADCRRPKEELVEVAIST
jgi:hypothetical protein